tara:strand:- start:26064 stop:27143 length:1080 start_codon:yes stop_codon:yes gene_type:complete
MKKICVVTTSFAKGGAERSSAILTQMLYRLGYEVYVLMTKNDIDYEFSGIPFNLEKNYGSGLSEFKKIKILRAYFKKHDFDVMIDNRARSGFIKDYILYNFVFKAKKKIAVVRSFCLKTYFPSNRCLTRLLYKNKSILVAVSQEIKDAVVETYGLHNTKLIYNAVGMDAITDKADEQISLDENFILWYGRIDESVKNLTLLLMAYKKSILPKNNIKLYIIGQGKDVPFLNEKIQDLQFKENVQHMPFLKNPFPYVKKAKFTTLTSHYEGFPRVLIESFVCGTPVISVDCKSGPKEIITHGYNGLLVENHNVAALANAFNSFIEDKSLYMACKKNTKASVDKYSMENIAEDWRALIENDI